MSKRIKLEEKIHALHKKCYTTNHGKKKGVCDSCSSQEICLLINKKGETK